MVDIDTLDQKTANPDAQQEISEYQVPETQYLAAAQWNALVQAVKELQTNLSTFITLTENSLRAMFERMDAVEDSRVSTAEEQSFTDLQKSQARRNIGAANTTDTSTLLTAQLKLVAQIQRLSYRSIVADGIMPPKAWGTFQSSGQTYTGIGLTLTMHSGAHFKMDQATVSYGRCLTVIIHTASPSSSIDDRIDIAPAQGYRIRRFEAYANAYSNNFQFTMRVKDSATAAVTVNATAGKYVVEDYGSNGTASAALLISCPATSDTTNRWLCFSHFVVELVAVTTDS